MTKIQMNKTVLNLEHLDLGFVSDFDIRISDLVILTTFLLSRSIAVDDQSSAAVGAHQNTQGLYFSVIDVSDTGFLRFGTNEVRAPLHRNPVSTHGFLNTVFI